MQMTLKHTFSTCQYAAISGLSTLNNKGTHMASLAALFMGWLHWRFHSMASGLQFLQHTLVTNK
jgi:hypothetical protein